MLGCNDSSRENGIALIAVLWALVLLSVIAVGFLRETRGETALVRNAVESAKARALADAGIQRAILELYRDEVNTRWKADGTAYLWRFANGEVRIRIQDQAGRIDLNQAPAEILERLFVVAGAGDSEAAALADAVADFRDTNDLRRVNGAENDDYRAAGDLRGAKNAPFYHIAELQQVFGMTRALFERVEPAVTVHSDEATIDPLTAPAEALLALPGADPAEIEDFLARRSDIDGNVDLDALPIALVAAAAEYVSRDGASRAYSIRAEAKTEAGAVFTRTIVIRQ